MTDVWEPSCAGSADGVVVADVAPQPALTARTMSPSPSLWAHAPIAFTIAVSLPPQAGGPSPLPKRGPPRGQTVRVRTPARQRSCQYWILDIWPILAVATALRSGLPGWAVRTWTAEESTRSVR